MLPYWEILVAMRVLGKAKLYPIIHTNDVVSVWVRAWIAELTFANWKQAADVIQQFPNVHMSANGLFNFPVGNTDQYISVQLAFPQGIAVITGIK